MEKNAQLVIVTLPANILHQLAKPITASEEVKDIATKMISLMKSNNGLGLAAPQVGLSWQMFVMYIPGEMTEAKVFLNPKIVGRIGQEIGEEACLSIPGIKKNIKRSKIINIEATDLDGKQIKAKYKGLSARCFQHELDHLQGRLITNYK